jgi:Double zinc ribbon
MRAVLDSRKRPANLLMNTGQPSTPPRSPMFYVGNAVALIGVLLFLSTFVTFLMNFGNFANFENQVRSDGFRALGGMALIFIGTSMAGIGGGKIIGRRLVQNIEQLRDQIQLNAPPRELSPVRCTYCNVENDPKLSNCTGCGAPLSKKRRCAGCGTVNEPTAKFCNQCGAAL